MFYLSSYHEHYHFYGVSSDKFSLSLSKEGCGWGLRWSWRNGHRSSKLSWVIWYNIVQVAVFVYEMELNPSWLVFSNLLITWLTFYFIWFIYLYFYLYFFVWVFFFFFGGGRGGTVETFVQTHCKRWTEALYCC